MNNSLFGEKKPFKFILVGIINTIVGSAIMFSLYNIAHCSYWFSSASNYILTSILSFFLNKYFTFESKEWSWGQVLKFAINIAVCYLLAFGIAKPLIFRLLSGQNARLQTNIAMLTGMVLFTTFHYLGQSLFAFKD